MKKKELKNLAIKIAEAENIIKNSNNEDEIKKAQGLIFKLSTKITNLDDMIIIDEYIQKILKNN